MQLRGPAASETYTGAFTVPAKRRRLKVKVPLMYVGKNPEEPGHGNTCVTWTQNMEARPYRTNHLLFKYHPVILPFRRTQPGRLSTDFPSTTCCSSAISMYARREPVPPPVPCPVPSPVFISDRTRRVQHRSQTLNKKQLQRLTKHDPL